MSSFPHYIQPDIMDCGPTCLRIIAAYYKRDISLKDLRLLSYTSREGSSLMGLSDAAESIGLHSAGVKLNWKQLRDEAVLPCIIHWNQNHFVVVYKIALHRGEWTIYVSDPIVGLIKYREDSFLKSWLQINNSNELSGKGVALLLEPTPSFFQQRNEDKSHRENYTLHNLLSYLKPHRNSLSQIFFAMVIASFLSILLPFITQSIIDQGVILGKLDFIKIMLIAQLLIVLGQLVNDLIRNRIMLHMTTRVSISLISDFLSKLMRLPISYFDSKMTGDILQRIQDHSRIQDFLTNSLLSIVMATVLLFVYGSILGGYNI